MQKPTNLNEIWAEKDLCKRLDLPVTKSGRSLQLNPGFDSHRHI
jgi:hypothetical protein